MVPFRRTGNMFQYTLCAEWKLAALGKLGTRYGVVVSFSGQGGRVNCPSFLLLRTHRLKPRILVLRASAHCRCTFSCDTLVKLYDKKHVRKLHEKDSGG